jgi:hypothetical protein
MKSQINHPATLKGRRPIVFAFYAPLCAMRILLNFFYGRSLFSVVFRGPWTVACGRFFLSIVFCGLLAVDFGLLFVHPAFSAQVILQWDPNPDPRIAGYKIYYGKQSKTYPYTVDAGNKTTAILSNLETGQTYYLTATAYDASKNESPFSQELSFRTPTQSLARNSSGDFNGDNQTDILWQHQGTGEVYVWFMDGSSFIRDQYIQTVKEIEWKIVGTGDFNGDGKPDILWHHQQRGDVYVWFMDGPTFVRDQYIRTVGDDPNWKIAGVGDFNGDGKPDILWHHQQRGDVYVWFMDGPTFVRDQYIRTVGDDLNWKIAGVGDFNGDGKPDILWHHQQRGDVYVWFMDGANFLSHQYIRTVPEIDWQIEAVGDYNGNGKPDILWRNHRTGEVYVWFMDGATFITDQHIRTIPDTNWKIVN